MLHDVPEAAAESAAVGVSRIALGVEYKGSRYRGFQRQRAGVPSVQEALESALSRVAGRHPVALSCAGRTDALVHASGQVVHFDTSVERSMHAWVMGANMNLRLSVQGEVVSQPSEAILVMVHADGALLPMSIR